MKKTTVVLATLFSAAAFSSAHAQGVRLGLRAGANYSNLTGNIQNENTYNNKVGFMGGVILNADLSGDGFLSIQPEVLYSQKGFENKPTEYTNTLLGVGYTQKREGKVNYNYLDVPVLLKINAGGLIFEAGPQYSYLLSSNNETKTTTTRLPNGTPSVSEAENKNDVSGLKRSELGYAAGIGYQADNGLSLNLRYTGAFSDFVKSDNGTYFDGDLKNARHSAFQLSLGYLIPSK
ncbi:MULTISPECIES: porin family protein [Hymenobacter]|uniref:PorT family protein n=1 Tax=Hymenobacter jejuensis TaxID=2502781 RepID=A0A5B7ZWY0_9BACT|nr:MULTISPECIES: porin family protein [Hymenobacter]MBC6992300.1 PorT family protein [Hymenobacter sp. BT491]QDA59661.1 PorT family protein [Hymenobacter jejuensis]